jgi:hypothetical protein
MTHQGKTYQQQNKGQVSEKDRPRTRSQSFQSDSDKDRPRTRSQSFQSDSEKDHLKAHSQSSQEQPSEKSATPEQFTIDRTKKVLIRKIEDRYGDIRLPNKYQKEKEERKHDDIFTLDTSSIETGNNNISVVFSFYLMYISFRILQFYCYRRAVSK